MNNVTRSDFEVLTTKISLKRTFISCFFLLFFKTVINDGLCYTGVLTHFALLRTGSFHENILSFFWRVGGSIHDFSVMI